MNKDSEINNEQKAKIIERDTLGEYLRKIRISNRIDIHKMAVETKLNIDYIDAIEKNEFNKIPGNTYIKIFLKSIAKYLELDPDEIYNHYLSEYPPASTKTIEENDLISRQDIDSAFEKKSPKSIIFFLILGSAILLFIFLFQNGYNIQPSKTPNKKNETIHTSTVLDKKVEIPPIDSSIVTSDPAKSLKEIEKESSLDKESRFIVEKRGKLKVKIKCTDKSIYLFVFRNGRMWNQKLNKGDFKIFASDTSIYFRTSSVKSTKLFINNKSTSIIKGYSRFFRINEKGLFSISKERWKEITNNQ